jgi:hypothetical protein
VEIRILEVCTLNASVQRQRNKNCCAFAQAEDLIWGPCWQFLRVSGFWQQGQLVVQGNTDVCGGGLCGKSCDESVQLLCVRSLKEGEVSDVVRCLCELSL